MKSHDITLLFLISGFMKKDLLWVWCFFSVLIYMHCFPDLALKLGACHSFCKMQWWPHIKYSWWIPGDKVRGERAAYNSKKSLGYANNPNLIFACQASDSHRRPSCVALSGCGWNSIFDACCWDIPQSSVRCKAGHHASTQHPVPYQSSPGIRRG